MMKTSKNKRRQQQQQSGRPVLVTFYVIHQRSHGGGGGARATTSSHDVWHHHHRRRQHHHHSDGGRHDERRRWHGGKFPNNQRADLLEYSRQLRALARQQATTAAAARSPATPRRHRHDAANTTAVAVCGDEGQPAPAAVNRPERAMGRQQIRQSCFGGEGWSWSAGRCCSCSSSPSAAAAPASRGAVTHGDQVGWRMEMTARRTGGALIKRVGRLWCRSAGKLTQVAKTRRDHSWLVKKLMSVFQKRSR